MSSGSPDYSPRIIVSGSNDEQQKLGVTEVDSVCTFTQEIKSWLVFNFGPNTAHLARDAVATTDSFPVPNKSWIFLDVPTISVHAVCAAGETATLYVWGVY